MNKKLLQNWIKEGLAVKDLGDGAWGWTELAKRILPDMTRCFLSDLLYEKDTPKNVMRSKIKNITSYGFNEEGFVLTDEE